MTIEIKSYRSIHGFRYIRVSELAEIDQAYFRAWMIGQTQPIIEELHDDTDAVYLHDYERWVRERKGCHQFAATWD